MFGHVVRNIQRQTRAGPEHLDSQSPKSKPAVPNRCKLKTGRLDEVNRSQTGVPK